MTENSLVTGRVFTKLFFSFVVVLFLGMVVLDFSLRQVMEQSLRAQAEESLAGEARLVAAHISAGSLVQCSATDCPPGRRRCRGAKLPSSTLRAGRLPPHRDVAGFDVRGAPRGRGDP